MKREIQQHKIPNQRPSQFFFRLTKIAVAQICRSVGFKAAQVPALDALTDIAARYIQELAKSSAASANLYGRTDCNVFDVILAVEDLCSVQGFSGASNYVTHLSLYDSSAIKDVIRFVDYSTEIPFAIPLTHDWVKDGKHLVLQFPQSSHNISGLRHIPEWLPPIPSMTCAGDEKRGKEGKWEFGWSCSEAGGGEQGKEAQGKRELPLKRARVRFKMGLGLTEDGEFEIGMKKEVCKGRKRVVLVRKKIRER